MIKLVSLRLRNFKQYENASINFPDQGRILIKGKNEAGKSSIFEAIFFALFSDTLYIGTIGDLIRFGSDKALVELTIKTNEKLITIRRILSPNKSQDATLLIKAINDPGLKQELIKGATNVNSRIIKEIGLDKDILLNTCLIAQKKLDTLESLRAGDRRKIISKLFNLDYLLNITEKAKEIKNELEAKKPHYELLKKAGEAKKILPQIEKEIEEIHKEIERIEKIEKAKNIHNMEEKIKYLNEEIKAFETTFEAIKKNVETLESLKEEERKIEEIKNIEGKIQILENQKEKILKEMSSLEERVRTENELINQMHKLLEVIEIKQKIENLEKTINEGNFKLTNLQEKLIKSRELENKIQKERELYEEKERLQKKEEKILIKKNILEKRTEKLKNILGKIQEIPRWEEIYKKSLEFHKQKEIINDLNIKVNKYRKSLIAFLGLITFSLISSIFISKFFFIAIGILSIISIFFYQTYSKYNKEYIKEKKLTDYLEKDIPKELKEKDKEIVESELDKIRRKKSNKKEQILRVEEKIKFNLNQINTTLTNIVEKKAYIENELNNIAQHKKELGKLLSELSEKLKEDTINKMEEKLEKELEVLKKKEKELKILKEIDPMPDKELSQVISQKGSIENELDNIERLKKEMERKRKDYQNMDNEIVKEKTILEAKLKEIKRSDDEYLTEIKRKIKQFEEEGVKEEYEKLSQELNRKKGEKVSLERNYKELIEEFYKKFSEDDWKNFINIEFDERMKETLLKKEKELLQEKGEKEGIIREYEQKTGNKRENLDPEKIDEEYFKLEKEIIKMNYAMRIVESTREAILKAISPRTEAFMQKILPILTSDRYHYVEIGDDYKLKVYTSFKEEPLEKTIFSGGTQDQLSLALRLAFAMATLPQDKGIQPKFIFLDEPLGSFDEDRAKGLLYLLTEGEVAEHFDQIFVVTHIPIDESIFDEIYYVDNGRIIKIEGNSNQALNYEDNL
jgi:exonuclease SbcC